MDNVRGRLAGGEGGNGWGGGEAGLRATTNGKREVRGGPYPALPSNPYPPTSSSLSSTIQVNKKSAQ